MGMYTEFHFNAELSQDTPKNVIDILKFMVGQTEVIPQTPMHSLFELFETERWKFMLRSDSYYFAADTYSTLRYDDLGGCYFLCIRCNLKNYNNEIQKFIDWIYPYVNEEDGTFLGFYRYEESTEPTLIYYSPEPKEEIKQSVENSALKDIHLLLEKYAEEGLYIENVYADWRTTVSGEKYLIDFHAEFSNDKK